MFTSRRTRTGAAIAVTAGLALAAAGCSSTDPLQGGQSAAAPSAGTIVVGSQAYPSNEIIAEIYAQALEGAGMVVSRQFNIGQREAYMPELESGAITLFPEYTGNLLEYLEPSAISAGASPEEVYASLQTALPAGLTALEMSPATDQDTYTVTKATAAQYGITSIADLSKLPQPVTVGGSPELPDRPYGKKGLQDVYGISAQFSATGATTLEDLLAGTVQVADIYSADPSFQTADIVALTDPKNLILPSNVVPLVSSDAAGSVADVINAVSAKLTPEGLVALNVQNTVDQKQPAEIAKAWLSQNGLS